MIDWQKYGVSLALCCCLLASATTAQAVSDPSISSTHNFYASYTFGGELYLGEGLAFEMSAYAGIENLLPKLDLRAGAGFIAADRAAFKVSGDALYSLYARGTDTYALSLGGGPRVVLGPAFDIGVGALVQLELPSSGRANLFVEPGVDLYFLDALQLAPSLSVGARYRF